MRRCFAFLCLVLCVALTVLGIGIYYSYPSLRNFEMATTWPFADSTAPMEYHLTEYREGAGLGFLKLYLALASSSLLLGGYLLWKDRRKTAAGSAL